MVANAPEPEVLERLIGFGRDLRRKGLPVGTGRIVTFCRAAGALGLVERDDVYWAGRSSLISRPEDVEAFLLEVLSEFAVTIPEVGRVAAEEPPVVVVTSNRTRELHDALKRRCLYHWIDHPALDREIEIIRARAPEVPEVLARDVASAVSRLRGFDIAKRPGVAETIDWANAVSFLGAEHLDEETAAATLGTVLKDHDDQQLAVDRLGEVVDGRERS